jgi:transcriptional regulator with XRE-family HTH domain
MIPPVDVMRLGSQYRALRLRKELRQDDVGRLARLSRSVISRLERGLVDNVRVGDLDRVATALGARLDIRMRWNGEALDRLVDESHAMLVDIVIALLRATGWDVAVEVSYSIWGERGSIDILAFHRATGILVVVEVKSVVPDNQEMLATLDRKTRLAARIARDRGWEARSVARLLVVGDSATSRRRVARLASTYDVAFPLRGQAVRQWVRTPVGSMSGLLFLSCGPRGSGRKAGLVRHRIRRGRTARARPVDVDTARRERV